jgi:hypothetical protein
MVDSVCSIVKGPVGWLVLLDGVRVGGVYGSRVEALNAATTAAAFVVEDGGGVQISVPANPTYDNAPDQWSAKWEAVIGRQNPSI